MDEIISAIEEKMLEHQIQREKLYVRLRAGEFERYSEETTTIHNLTVKINQLFHGIVLIRKSLNDDVNVG